MNARGERAAGLVAGIAGEANTSAEPEALAAYAIDGRQPRAVVRPGSGEETAEILRMCAAEKLAVVPAGAGTKLGIGAAPRRYDVALVTTRMNRVEGYDPGDLTLSVESGARLADIAALLARHRQFLPLSAPYEARATIGGTVGSGVDSPLRQGFGTTRDFLLGAGFVTGSGSQAKSGGRVVKNVAGYDLHKLLVGSLGTLGVITRLNFKTFPQARGQGGFLATFGAETGALDFLRRVTQSALAPTTLEILSPRAWEIVGREGGAAKGELVLRGPAWVAAAGFGGSEAVLGRCGSELGRMAREAGAAERLLLDEARRAQVWERLREAIPLLLGASPQAAIARIGVVPSRMGEIFAAARASAEREALPFAIVGRAAGAAYVAFLPEKAEEGAGERLGRAAGAMADAAAQAGGFSSIPWCPAEVKSLVPLWGRERPDLGLMREVKRAFDPEGVLSPGRFMGGI